jgi:hypothetical protein
MAPSLIICWLEALCNLASVMSFAGIQPYLCWSAHWNWVQLQLRFTGHSPQWSFRQQRFIWLPSGSDYPLLDTVHSVISGSGLSWYVVVWVKGGHSLYMSLMIYYPHTEFPNLPSCMDK